MSSIRSSFAAKKKKKKTVFRIIWILEIQASIQLSLLGSLLQIFSLFFLTHINFKLIMDLMESYHCQKNSTWKVMSYRGMERGNLSILQYQLPQKQYRVLETACHIHKHTHTHTVVLYRRKREVHKAAVIFLLTNFLFFLLALKMLKKCLQC